MGVVDFLGDKMGGGIGVSAGSLVSILAGALLATDAGGPTEPVGEEAGADVFAGFAAAGPVPVVVEPSCPGTGIGTGVVILGVTAVPPGVRTGGGIVDSVRGCAARLALR